MTFFEYFCVILFGIGCLAGMFLLAMVFWENDE